MIFFIQFKFLIKWRLIYKSYKKILLNNISFFEDLKLEKDKEIKTLTNIFDLIETNYNCQYQK